MTTTKAPELHQLYKRAADPSFRGYEVGSNGTYTAQYCGPGWSKVVADIYEVCCDRPDCQPWTTCRSRTHYDPKGQSYICAVSDKCATWTFIDSLGETAAVHYEYNCGSDRTVVQTVPPGATIIKMRVTTTVNNAGKIDYSTASPFVVSAAQKTLTTPTATKKITVTASATSSNATLAAGSPSAAPEAKSSLSASGGMIAGIAVGAVVVVALVALLSWLLWRRRQKRAGARPMDLGPDMGASRGPTADGGFVPVGRHEQHFVAEIDGQPAYAEMETAPGRVKLAYEMGSPNAQTKPTYEMDGGAHVPNNAKR
ncbi:hypothetical protein EJ06DRAFT_552441 [Trichodelitschia bisporula]|uniref:Mid2 domain-containing protein n=1 Tax=Trichodelitschia bisporula TaxID=703511 RepID=A0A6G1I9U8_9PEZI|nr:hypothetical protein EJ06DRAFT_552441 [Trichodelitschia bisporula]